MSTKKLKIVSSCCGGYARWNSTVQEYNCQSCGKFCEIVSTPISSEEEEINAITVPMTCCGKCGEPREKGTEHICTPKLVDKKCEKCGSINYNFKDGKLCFNCQEVTLYKPVDFDWESHYPVLEDFEEVIGTDCQCGLGSSMHYHPDCEYLKEEINFPQNFGKVKANDNEVLPIPEEVVECCELCKHFDYCTPKTCSCHIPPLEEGKLSVSHGNITHPANECKTCLDCIECDKNFKEAKENGELDKLISPLEVKEGWEERFDKEFPLPKENNEKVAILLRDLKSFISQTIQETEARVEQEERQFILNILDGINEADRQMGNKGGGTLAIRLALQSRI